MKRTQRNRLLHPFNIALGLFFLGFVTITAETQITNPYKVIIVQGSGSRIDGQLNHIWPSTMEVSLLAYKALIMQGSDDDKIKYLSAEPNIQMDLNKDGSFDTIEVASMANLEQSIVDWASDAHDVILFLVGHGEPGVFYLNGTETLTGNELNQWLNQLEEKIPGHITVIYDASYSQSLLFPQPHSDRRYLISSSTSDQPAVMENDELRSFSYYFWNEFRMNGGLLNSFHRARQAMSYDQVAKLDTNGDGMLTRDDYDIFRGYLIGQAWKGQKFSIKETSPAENLTINTDTAIPFSIQVNIASNDQNSILGGQVYAMTNLTGSIKAIEAYVRIKPLPDISGLSEGVKQDLECTLEAQHYFCTGEYPFYTKGEYQLSFHIKNTATGESESQSITITQITGVDHLYKTIIVAGGGPVDASGVEDPIWDRILALAIESRGALRVQGYEKNEFKFLTAGDVRLDLDENGEYDDPVERATLSNLKNAITEWAKDAANVVLYIVDHGGDRTLKLSNEETLYASDLKIWLDTLQNTIPGYVVVIIEACYSGSFIPDLATKRRQVIASALETQKAVLGNANGRADLEQIPYNSFSHYFWDRIRDGKTLKTAFLTARLGASQQNTVAINSSEPQRQTALLDANSDHQYDLVDDDLVRNICLGNCVGHGSDAPNIIEYQPRSINVALTKKDHIILNGETQQSFTVKISSIDTITASWGTVMRPDYVSPDNNDPLIDFPTFELICEREKEFHTCQGEYTKFDVNGEYQVTLMAINRSGQATLPVKVTIEQIGGIDNAIIKTDDYIASYDENKGVLFIGDVTVEQEHYQVELKLNNNQYVLKSASNAIRLYDSPAQFNPTTGLLNIPRVFFKDHFYDVTMQSKGNYTFDLLTVTEK